MVLTIACRTMRLSLLFSLTPATFGDDTNCPLLLNTFFAPRVARRRQASRGVFRPSPELLDKTRKKTHFAGFFNQKSHNLV
jgi:hypothetical protein